MPNILQSLRTKLRRADQTRSAAATPSGMVKARQAGTAAAYRRVTAMLLLIQLALWAGLGGIAVAGRTLWQSALLLIPAGLGVWAVSRWVWGSAGDGSQAPSRPGQGRRVPRSWEVLVLWPCLLVDATFVLHTLLSLLHRLMPSYPAGILRVFIPVVLTLCVLLGRRNGAAYGVSLWRWLLPLLAVWVLLHVLLDRGFDHLYPLLGRGWKATGRATVTGLGALWPVGLLFLLPECSGGGMSSRSGKPPRTVQYVLLPLLLCCLLALALGCSVAWQAANDPSVGYRLLMPERGSGSMMISGLWALFWLLGLMTAFCTVLMASQKLVIKAFPGCIPWVPVLMAALPAAVLLWVWPDQLPPLVMQLLPWRLAPWAVAAAWAAGKRLMHRRKRR